MTQANRLLWISLVTGCGAAAAMEIPPATSTAALPDRDQDGIPDDRDQCPDVPESPNSFQDDDGCDDCVLLVPDSKIVINVRVFFAKNDDALGEENRQALDALAEQLQRLTELRLAVDGHRDGAEAPGTPDLAERRARAARDYLINQGVRGERLEVRAHGVARPAPRDGNRDPAVLNRRVEFSILGN